MKSQISSLSAMQKSTNIFFLFQLVIFFACLNLAFADFSRVKRPIFRERTGRQAQSSEARPPPPRRLRPLERQGQVNQIPSNERNRQEPRVLPPRNRFSDFGLSDAEYNKGQNFGKRPNFRPVKFPNFSQHGFGNGNGYSGGFGSADSERLGVGLTNSPLGYMAHLLRLMSYLVSLCKKKLA